jgi:hypothetical protein
MKYDDTNKGALWKTQEDYRVVRQGKINMDGNDRRVIAVSRKNAQGQSIISLYEEIANIKPYVSTNEKSPSAKGLIDVRKTEATKSIGVWKKQKQSDGEEFWSVAISEYKPKEENDTDNNDLDNTYVSEQDDSIPF